MKTKSLPIACLFFVLLMSCSLCFADGVFIPTVVRKFPDIPLQRALVKYADGVETLIVESTLDGDGERFGWIIPLPGVPTKLEKITPGLLQTLSLQLEPEIVVRISGQEFPSLLIVPVVIICLGAIFLGVRGFLAGIVLGICFMFVAPGFIALRDGPKDAYGVKLLRSETIGDYETFVIEAQKSADLNEWLADNDFTVIPEEALPVIEDYIDKGWCFFAAKLRKEEVFRSAPHPILMEFETDRPVYPMRLTALQDSRLHLELFVLAEDEAVAVNYDLRKEYCNYFSLQDLPSSMPGDDRKNRARYISHQFSDGTQFRHTRRLLRSQAQIGHPDAFRIFWDGCVVTKFIGQIPASDIKEDMLIEFKPAEPYRYRVQVTEASVSQIVGEDTLTIFCLIVLPIFTVFYRIAKARSKLKQLRFYLLMFLFFSPVVVYLVVFAVTDIQPVGALGSAGDTPATEYVKIGRPGDEWRGFKEGLQWFFKSLDQLDGAVLGDEALEEYLTDRHSEQFHNPFTGTAVIIEDSPGNVTPVRENGVITGVNLYWRDGSPYYQQLVDNLRELDFDGLFQQLRDRSPAVRRRAVLELQRRGDPVAVEPLKALFVGRDRRVGNRAFIRNRQLENLAFIAVAAISKDPEMVEHLIVMLADKDRKIRISAAAALGQIRDSRAVAPLLRMLYNGDRFTPAPESTAALKAIAAINHPGSVEPLIDLYALAVEQREGPRVQLLAALQEMTGRDLGTDPQQWRGWWEQNSESPASGKEIAAELQRYRGESTRQSYTHTRQQKVYSLLSELKSPDTEVRREACWQLYNISVRNPDALKPAVQPLVKALQNSNDPLRKSYASILGNTKDPRAIEALFALLSDEEINTNRSAAVALGKLWGDRPIDPLLGLLAEGDSNARGAAATALGVVGDDRAVEELITVLADEDRHVSLSAAKALIRIGRPDGIDAVLSLLRARHPNRMNIVHSLANKKEPRAIPYMITLLRDLNPRMQKHMARYLTRMTGQEFGTDADRWQQWWELNKDRLLAEGL